MPRFSHLTWPEDEQNSFWRNHKYQVEALLNEMNLDLFAGKFKLTSYANTITLSRSGDLDVISPTLEVSVSPRPYQLRVKVTWERLSSPPFIDRFSKQYDFDPIFIVTVFEHYALLFLRVNRR